ncbi:MULTISPECIES: hypothetical protein [unclassified Rhizobium]|uniref:hypothetical protein n=1 Tax=unclassified Rhizobium TaxID=2613769 RepID=UPI0006466FD4|nr:MULTISPECIES: hypothetical protein [unclassified Rhizobium]RKD50411.1 hypothetical protein BJ928_12281 [Rhizobium sp. WW_1]
MTTIQTIGELLGQLPSAFSFGEISLGSIAAEQRELLREIENFDPLRLTACFSGLLTVPELQSNCVRLEVLTHLCFSLARGTRKPTEKIIARLFKAVGGGVSGRLEDPAEDVFVSLIVTQRGNFRVLEGIWESAGFHTQRIVNALEMAVNIDAEAFMPMLECVYALLRLSDLVCERAALQRYTSGNVRPEEKLPSKILESARLLRQRIRFTEEELIAAGISALKLAEFGFDPRSRFKLTSDRIGHSALERHPVVFRNGEFYLLLPTAVTAAIRRFVIERMEQMGLRDFFAGLLSHEIAIAANRIPLLGGNTGAPVEFRKTDNGLIAGVMFMADRGRFMNFVFFGDTLQDFDANGGLIGTYPTKNAAGLTADIEKWISHAHETARRAPDFRDGITLLVGCGVGRGMLDVTPKREYENWKVEPISAPDLFTLSSLSDFKPLSLWRLLNGRDSVEALGVNFLNVNGLLNLVAWARALGGHLVPHASMPAEFGNGEGEGEKMILVEQNALLKIRQEVAEKDDKHALLAIDGKWIPTQRDGQSIFKEDLGRPFYVSETSKERWPMAVYETTMRPWWVQLETTDKTIGNFAYQRYQMLRTWLCFAAPVLDTAFPQIPPGPILWKVRFEGDLGDRAASHEGQFLTIEQTLTFLDVEVTWSTISIDVGAEFEDAIYNPVNVAERALVTRFVEGVARLANTPLDDATLDSLVTKIVPSPEARQSHAFSAQGFRDFVKRSTWRSPVKIDVDDGAAIKLGLGWRNRPRSEGGEIIGREACTIYLNGIVKLLENEICTDLREFDRRSVIVFALMNHEAAASDRDNWRRTASAVVALHKDRNATINAIAEHEAELNTVFQATRLIVEFAICECPLEGGMKPGELDMSRIMAKIILTCGLGGWSDSIRWQAMKPLVHITPLGDIHANVDFQEEILTPYGRTMTGAVVQENIENYARNLLEPTVTPTDGSRIDGNFIAAFEEQFGAPIDVARKFIDDIEDMGIKQEKPVLALKRSDVLALGDGKDAPYADGIKRLLEVLTLKSRPCWRKVPEGYLEKDLFPWRFRRRLSMLRKPFIQLDDTEDPKLIVAPGILRDGFAYSFSNYYKGDFPLWQLTPKMKVWAGKARDKMGKKFSTEVAARLKELGWNVETEVRITKLLGKGFALDYGDIDVLAWKAESDRVLLVECKDVQHRKTDGEIAEQLLDFRGELSENGKPDLLLKHLRRVELINAHVPEVKKYLKLTAQPKLEGHFVFKNPVPMKFAWDRMKERAQFNLFSELQEL